MKKLLSIFTVLSIFAVIGLASNADARREDPKPPRCDGPRDRCPR